MTQLDGKALRELRKRKGWSQRELADRAKLNQQTIYRLERGQTRANERTIKELAGALKAGRDVLVGDAPLPAAGPAQSRLDRSSDMQVRYSDSARNALTLAARRYGVSSAAILESAPFLFVTVAEQSLRQRRERLAALQAKVAEAEQLQGSVPHLSSLLTYNTHADAILDAERASIAAHDLFGARIPDDAEIANSDANEGTDNPFAAFLRDLGAETQGVADFGWWPEWDTPQFEVCPEESLALVGGDAQAAGYIRMGSAALYKMPKEVAAGGAAVRAAWANAEGAASAASFPEIDLDDLIASVASEGTR
jgi:transcriptional regulator with XRE-family HTH domain